MMSVTIYLVYLLIYGFQSDMEEARPKIRKESVTALRETKVVQPHDQLSAYINKNLIQKNALAQTEPAQNTRLTDAPVVPMNTDPEIRTTQDGKSYWCRSVPVVVQTDPVICQYPDACFGCNGPIIRPEVESAAPLCADGSMSELYHVECCPSSFANGVAECPSAEQCFQAESPPQDFCSCGDRPDCRLVKIGPQIQCVCIQN